MQYDMIIIGGGMVGASLALALAETPLRIALVDAQPFGSKTDARLIALNYSSHCLLQNLGVWHLLANDAAAIHEVHVSNRGQFGTTRIHKSELNLPALGYVVPAQTINAALNIALSEMSTITIYRPAVLKTLTQDTHKVAVTLTTAAGEIALEARHLIGADGNHSTVRELAGITAETIDYQQSAIVNVTQLQRPHRHIAYERFHSQGAIAMLPLTDDRSATIWTAKNIQVEALLKLDDDAFLAELQKQFGYRLGRLTHIGTRHIYPLVQIKAAQTLKDRVVLIGNAAHTLHPIAAQGLNLALAEIAMLAQIIQAQPEHPQWQDYLAWQQQQQTLSMRLSHELPRLFASDFFLVNLARQVGMLGLDILRPLKRRFARQAIGRTGLVPRLLLTRDRN